MEKIQNIINLEENIDVYLKIKERINEKLTEKEKFFIDEKICDFFRNKKYDFIFIPESSKPFLKNVAELYSNNVYTIDKKEYDNDDLINLLYDIKNDKYNNEQKQSIIFKIIEQIEKNDNNEFEKTFKNTFLSIHKFKSNQRKLIIKYIYDENSLQNIRNIIHCNKEKSFCILDDFINTGETINFIYDKLNLYFESLNLDVVSIFKN